MVNALGTLRSVTDEMKEKRFAEFVISSEAVDSYGTVFRLSGWDLKRYNQNPLVGYNHQIFSTDPDNIIGRSEVFIEDDKLVGRVFFEDAETNPKAEKIMRKVFNGTLNMASVGAMINEAHWGKRSDNEDPEILYFTNQELYEWSVVTVGANPDAIKRSMETIETIKKDITPEPPAPETEKRSVFEAQLSINKNQF